MLVNRNNNKENWSGLLDDREGIILAVVPPLLLGLGSAFAILSNHLVGSIALWVCIALVIFAGGTIALIRGMPVWGDTWLGAFVIFIALFLRLLMEEWKGVGPPVSYSLASVAITVFVSLALIFLIITIALKGWRRVGLVSISLSTTLGIGIWNTFARPPFNRGDLAMLVAPIGFTTAICIYFYLRKSDTVRILALMIVWIVCLSTTLVSSFVYQEWFDGRGRAFPLISLMSILSILLWGGPIIAWTIGIVRNMAKGLLIKKSE